MIPGFRVGIGPVCALQRGAGRVHGTRLTLCFVASLLVVTACNKGKQSATQTPGDGTDVSAQDESLGMGSPQQAQVEAMIAKGDFAGAVQLSESLIPKHPKDPGLHYAKGAALIRLEKIKEARAAQRKAIEVDSRFVPAYVALARDLAFGEGQLEQGLGYAKQAVEIDPKHVEAGLVLAMIQHDQGHRDMATQTLEALLDKGGRSAAVYVELARLYAGQASFEKARSALQSAIKLQPGEQSVPSWLLLGRIELSAKQPAAAKEAFESAIAAQSGNQDIRLAVVRAYLSAKMPKEALAHAQAVLQAMPEQAPALVAMARVTLALGRIEGPDGALTYVDKARKLAPDSLAVRLTRAQILARAGRCEEARKAADSLASQLSASHQESLKSAISTCK